MMIALVTILILTSNLYHALAFVPPSAAVPARCSWQQHQSAVISSDVTTDASSSATPVNEDKSTSSTPTSPALRENAIFDCDSSVEFWREFGNQNNPRTLQSNIADIAAIASRFAAQGPDALRYWLRHTGRSSYFAGNALLGNLGYQLHERLVKRNDDRSTTTSSSGSVLPFGMDSSVASRLLLEAYLCYEQDYKFIAERKYAEPWDMKSFRHRQSSPLNALRQTNRFVDEAINTLGRRYRQNDEDKNIWITDSASPKLYPDYYRTAFHYQTDGWMSKRSADVYETSTETLFLGRQDAMQRTSLPSMIKYANEKGSNGGQPLKILEVACGTGRFMTFIRDNLPLNAECTAVDLSPYYLDAARDNDAYWRKYRREEESRKGNSMSKDDIQPLRLVQAQAEDLPFEDESFDIVVCVYLYHELPQEIRSKASAEMARVLKQNGLLVFTDSIQRGDRPMLDKSLTQFENMNEPFYANYCEDNLPDHFLKEGLTPLTKGVRSTTKSLSFLKA
jgi:ubiquinone/menaquinone biosynthesis C-methylase UbiE